MPDHDPQQNEAHARRMIGSLRCLAECDGYEEEGRRRGLAAHEMKLLAERRAAIAKKNSHMAGRGG